MCADYSIGEEEEKGNLLTKETHQLLKDSKEIHFMGNVEGRDLFNRKSAEVIQFDDPALPQVHDRKPMESVIQSDEIHLDRFRCAERFVQFHLPVSAERCVWMDGLR